MLLLELKQNDKILRVYIAVKLRLAFAPALAPFSSFPKSRVASCNLFVKVQCSERSTCNNIISLCYTKYNRSNYY